MKRRLFNSAAILSLLLCVAAAGMVIWSYWTAHLVGLYSPAKSRQISAIANCGQLLVVVDSFRVPPAAVARFETAQYPANKQSSRASDWASGGTPIREFAGFGVAGGTAPSGLVRRVVAMPLWFIVLGSAVLPALAGIRLLRRRAPGCCVACGYDLRASPERCPECGRAVGLA